MLVRLSSGQLPTSSLVRRFLSPPSSSVDPSCTRWRVLHIIGMKSCRSMMNTSLKPLSQGLGRDKEGYEGSAKAIYYKQFGLKGTTKLDIHKYQSDMEHLRHETLKINRKERRAVAKADLSQQCRGCEGAGGRDSLPGPSFAPACPGRWRRREGGR